MRTGTHTDRAGHDWAMDATRWDPAGVMFSGAMERAWSEDEAAMLVALEVFDGLGVAGTASWLRARMRAAGMSGFPRGRRLRRAATQPG